MTYCFCIYLQLQRWVKLKLQKENSSAVKSRKNTTTTEMKHSITEQHQTRKPKHTETWSPGWNNNWRNFFRNQSNIALKGNFLNSKILDVFLLWQKDLCHTKVKNLLGKSFGAQGHFFQNPIEFTNLLVKQWCRNSLINLLDNYAAV